MMVDGPSLNKFIGAAFASFLGRRGRRNRCLALFVRHFEKSGTRRDAKRINGRNEQQYADEHENPIDLRDVGTACSGWVAHERDLARGGGQANSRSEEVDRSSARPIRKYVDMRAHAVDTCM